jgi:hypothetical protein
MNARSKKKWQNDGQPHFYLIRVYHINNDEKKLINIYNTTTSTKAYKEQTG